MDFTVQSVLTIGKCLEQLPDHVLELIMAKASRSMRNELLRSMEVCRRWRAAVPPSVVSMRIKFTSNSSFTTVSSQVLQFCNLKELLIDSYAMTKENFEHFLEALSKGCQHLESISLNLVAASTVVDASSIFINFSGMRKVCISGNCLIPPFAAKGAPLALLHISHNTFISQISMMHGCTATCLQHLELYNCRNLQTLPKLQDCPALETISIVHCQGLRELPSLGGLCRLRQLVISNLDALVAIPLLSNLASLTRLEISSCKILREVPGLVNVLPKLVELLLMDCNELETLPPPLSQAKALSSVHLSVPSNSASDSFFTSPICPQDALIPLESLSFQTSADRPSSLGSHPSLSRYSFKHSTNALHLPTLRAPVKDMSLEGCHSLLSVEELKGYTSLRTLSFQSCLKLQVLPSFHSLTLLQSLKFTFCPQLETIPELSPLILLKHLAISTCERLRRIPLLTNLCSLQHLSLILCDSLLEAPSLMGLNCLQELQIASCSSLAHMPSLNGLVSLSSLIISGCPLLQLPTFDHLQNLKFRHVEGFRTIEKQRTHATETATSMMLLKVS